MAQQKAKNENSSYGVFDQNTVEDEITARAEEVEILGYTIIEDVLSPDECKAIRDKSLELYQSEIVSQFGAEYLSEIQEENTIRLPLAYDELYLKLATKPKVLELVQAIMGEYVILHLQNVIINIPDKKHQQGNWHRDLAYQRYITSKPFAMNALFCIDDFTIENGCTELLPYSHKEEQMPSDSFIDQHHKKVIAPAGSAVVFNSFVYHRAGINTTNNTRVGINHVYVTPILKQQICIPTALEGKYAEDEFYNKFLGYDSKSLDSDAAFKDRRYQRTR